MGGLRAKTVSMKKRKIAIKAERRRYLKTPNQLGIQRHMALVRAEAKDEAAAEAKKQTAAVKKPARG
jgi:hypothetical protein